MRALIFIILLSAFFLRAEPPELLKIEARPSTEDLRPLLLWQEPGFEGVAYPVHIARIDLEEPTLEVVAIAEAAPKDPEKALTRNPVKLAKLGDLLVGVNANAFDEGGFFKKLMARPGRAVGLYGEAISEGHFFLGLFDPYAGSLWVSPSGGIDIAMLDEGGLADKTGVSNAVSGFHQLIRKGEVINWGLPEGEQGEYMARTAVGVSADGRWLYLLVAEGKRTLFSKDGYTEPAVARLLFGLGCSEALLLDCGGSSVLLANQGKGLRIMNRPAEGTVRPVPVLLGVRAKKEP